MSIRNTPPSAPAHLTMRTEEFRFNRNTDEDGSQFGHLASVETGDRVGTVP